MHVYKYVWVHAPTDAHVDSRERCWVSLSISLHFTPESQDLMESEALVVLPEVLAWLAELTW